VTGIRQIPIQNVYYLLAYAWDCFRDGQQRSLSTTDCPDNHNLLAQLLCAGIRQLVTRGVDRNYSLHVEQTSRLRGHIDVVGSYRRNTQLSGQMICEFDELTIDTPANRILKATCERLQRHSRLLSSANRGEVRYSLELLRDVSSTHLSSQVFRRVQLHSNNKHYRFLLHVCQLLHDCFLPDSRTGARRFVDVLENETQMHRVFEKFVLRFARRHCPGAKVSPMQIRWIGDWNVEAAKVLPDMHTDVTIEFAQRKTILDCKYYREALLTRHGRDKLHSSHLYQLNAYLQNKSRESGWENVRGILLYPAVDHHLDLNFSLLGQEIEIHSIDLDQPWQLIHQRLLGIVN